MKIGILAVQGDFIEHKKILESLGVKTIEVRLPSDLEEISGLIIPGGESTTFSLILKEYKLIVPLKKFGKTKPIFGTCAGSILLAKKVDGKKGLLDLIDVEIKRNAYGGQLDSFETELNIKNSGKLNGIFIRAPIIKKIGKEIEVLSEFDGNPVLVKQENILIATFHPELTNNKKVHKLFLKMCKN